ncbi:transcriptional regulator with XRE-family HTH domain [Paenibacillus mucilaginosus]|uniref:helix-turn-helix transcriptional regulator n=1 Tax=Paenibacillus mucilaginosus TaxID=61624 RepID=UPI003D248199
MDGKSIQAIRMHQGMTQEEFAEAIGVSQSTVAAVETGYRAVSDRVRIRIAQVFGTDDPILEAIRRAKGSKLLDV